jgi:nucleoside-diphosphate-sugar epimerase
MGKVMLVFGHGYTAAFLSRRLLAAGWRVIGTSRSDEKLAEMARLGVEGLRWPGADVSEALAAASHILLSVAPGADGDPVLAALGADIAAQAKHLEWLGYLSTTAVYGDHLGGWVDEDTALTPATARGRWRVAAEEGWQTLAGLPLHIFRLAGIYGPGRGPFAKLRNGTARRIIKEGQVFSRIHVEDIAQVLLASIARTLPGAVYNVCDDEAAPPEEVIGFAAKLLGLPVPEAVEFEKAELPAMARSFYAESKRVRNERIKRDLGIRLLYPTYREGLAALVKQETKR